MKKVAKPGECKAENGVLHQHVVLLFQALSEKSGRLSNPESDGKDSRDNLVNLSSQEQDSVTCWTRCKMPAPQWKVPALMAFHLVVKSDNSQKNQQYLNIDDLVSDERWQEDTDLHRCIRIWSEVALFWIIHSTAATMLANLFPRGLTRLVTPAHQLASSSPCKLGKCLYLLQPLLRFTVITSSICSFFTSILASLLLASS